MKDALGKTIRRGDRLIDRWGNLFNVSSITPRAAHLQDAKTGRRFRAESRAFLRVKGDLGNQQARRNRWVKEVLYERGDRLQR